MNAAGLRWTISRSHGIETIVLSKPEAGTMLTLFQVADVSTLAKAVTVCPSLAIAAASCRPAVSEPPRDLANGSFGSKGSAGISSRTSIFSIVDYQPRRYEPGGSV